VTIALQVIVSGLAAGGVYGLFAAGYSLIYRLTGIIHFAFGDLVGLGIFTTLLVLAGTTPVSQSGAHEPRFLFAILVGLAVCVLAGAATYVGLVQPYVARGSTIGWVAGTAAVAFAIRAVIGAVFQRSSYVFPDPLPFHRVGTAGYVHLGGAQVQARAFFVAGLVALFVLQAIRGSGAPGWLLVAAAVAIGAGAAAFYLRAPAARLALTVLAPAPLLFLALFLFSSDVSRLSLSTETAQAADERPRAPVVLIAFDELPVNSLLDANGHGAQRARSARAACARICCIARVSWSA